jgi:hypothetical protein
MLGEAAELQVLQLTNDAHAGTRDILIGVIGFALAVITFVLIIAIKGIDRLTAATVFASLWSLPGLVFMRRSSFSAHQTLLAPPFIFQLFFKLQRALVI